MSRLSSPTAPPARFLASPLLLGVLLLTAVTLIGALYRSRDTNRAPFISGYDWASHPDTLLVVYPTADACSTCNLSVSGWAQLGLKHHLDVLVIAAHKTEELKQARLTIPSSHFTVLTDIDTSIIHRFSKGDLIGGVRVTDGRISARQLGGTPSAQFLQAH